jgi:hypothetical protein
VNKRTAAEIATRIRLGEPLSLGWHWRRRTTCVVMGGLIFAIWRPGGVSDTSVAMGWSTGSWDFIPRRRVAANMHRDAFTQRVEYRPYLEQLLGALDRVANAP